MRQKKEGEAHIKSDKGGERGNGYMAGLFCVRLASVLFTALISALLRLHPLPAPSLLPNK